MRNELVSGLGKRQDQRNDRRSGNLSGRVDGADLDHEHSCMERLCEDYVCYITTKRDRLESGTSSRSDADDGILCVLDRLRVCRMMS